MGAGGCRLRRAQTPANHCPPAPSTQPPAQVPWTAMSWRRSRRMSVQWSLTATRLWSRYESRQEGVPRPCRGLGQSAIAVVMPTFHAAQGGRNAASESTVSKAEGQAMLDDMRASLEAKEWCGCLGDDAVPVRAIGPNPALTHLLTPAGCRPFAGTRATRPSRKLTAFCKTATCPTAAGWSMSSRTKPRWGWGGGRKERDREGQPCCMCFMLHAPLTPP